MGWQRNYWSRSWRSPWQVVVYRISPSMPSSREQRTSSSSDMYRTGRDSNRRSLRPSLGLRVLNPACLSPYWKWWLDFTFEFLSFPFRPSASIMSGKRDLPLASPFWPSIPQQVSTAQLRLSFDTRTPKYLSSSFPTFKDFPHPLLSHSPSSILSIASFINLSTIQATLDTLPFAFPCQSRTKRFSFFPPQQLTTFGFTIF